YVIARHLFNQGADVRVYLVAPRERISGDALTNLAVLERMGVPLVGALDGLEKERVIVDALLGTGLKSDVRGALADAIERINAAPAGASLVTLAVRPEVQGALEGRVRELMTAAYEDDAALTKLTRGKRAVALGPGIPTDEAMQKMVRRLAAALPLPMVIDADGL